MMQMQKVLPSCSEFINFEFLRLLGTAPFQGAEVGECLEAAASIRPDDPESWYNTWSGVAARAEQIGEDALRSGDREAARWAFLRASNYRRSSEFLLHRPGSLGDPRLFSAISKSVENFKKSCALLDSPFICLEIPYGDSDEAGDALPAYLFLPTPGSRTPGAKVPVLVGTGGFDSTQEELYYFLSSGARTRGYACLTFEGPGQGIVLRRKNPQYLRPDWEVVIGAVLDTLFTESKSHPEWNLDLDRVAIAGASMGGYFALRGATDPRIQAVVSIDGTCDMGEAMHSHLPSLLVTAIDRHWVSDAIFDKLLLTLARLDFKTGWEFGHGMLTMGFDSPVKVLREMLHKYTLLCPGSDGEPLPGKIKGPVLVTAATETLYFPLEIGPQRIYDELSHLKPGEGKELWIPDSASQGGLQAKVAALASLHAKVFGWLDGVFHMERQVLG
ncbi:Alpha/Beta hydrolase protein [Hypoxylon cercidicola]|nr:Alpha/Beta hydrolase protein [Hypoxylon cercidicola]